MSGFPALSGKRLVRVLEQLGFEVVRTKGSHFFLRQADGRRTVVPVHRGETIGRGLLAKILRDCDLSQDDLRRYL
ncbi:MAG: type II toxin-antitoxin system HicA family toxin [candidate division WOR-3 bacterium]|nr:MAG: type II toxin-antitoxin system HicA family toxin [candidate division WOR-3 bacterium]